MKRKVLALLSVTVLCTSLFACGKSSSNDKTDKVAKVSTETEDDTEITNKEEEVKSEPYIKQDISSDNIDISDDTKVILNSAKQGVLGYGDIYSDFDGIVVPTNELLSDSDNKVFTTRLNDLTSDTKNCLINDFLTCVKLESTSDEVKSEVFTLLSSETGVSSTLLDSIWVDIVLDD